MIHSIDISPDTPVSQNTRKKEDRFILFLDSTDGAHTGRSGYGMLSKYIPEGTTIEKYRSRYQSLGKRFIGGVLSRLSVSRWYHVSSLQLEYAAFRFLHSHRNARGIIHLLWGDRDLGFLDMVKNGATHTLCCTVHNCADTLKAVFNFPERLQKVDAFILMSETQRSYFKAIGIPADKLHVVLHGIDTAYFVPGNRKDSSLFQVLFVGSWRRNFAVLQQICVELGTLPYCAVKIVAPPKFKSLFADLPNVTFVSNLTNQELLEAYQQASCFLMTAEDATANNALLEALACGLPVVAERVGGIPEYLTEACALLCKPGDVQAIVQAVRELASSPSLQEKMATAARTRAEQLNWERVAERMHTIYEHL
jgi:glycosyltransferase involved in cell wall biosynthesis